MEYREELEDFEKAKNGIRFTSEEGYECFIYQSLGLGHLLGYIVLPPHHPLNGNDGSDLQVHGGITFSNFSSNHFRFENLFNKGYWILGFDCGHPGDKSIKVSIFEGRYRSTEYVKKELECLSKQITLESYIKPIAE